MAEQNIIKEEWLLVKEQAEEELKKIENLNFILEIRITDINNENLAEMEIIVDKYFKLMRERSEPNIIIFKSINKIDELEIIVDKYFKLIETKNELNYIYSNLPSIKNNLEDIINNTDQQKYKMWWLNVIKTDIKNRWNNMEKYSLKL